MTHDVEIKITANTDGTAAIHKSLAETMKDFDALQVKGAEASVKTAGSVKKVTEATEKLSFATAGATREFIVLGHEALTGNFSRMPGSLMVLGERAGGLQNIFKGVTAATVGWAAAIGAALYGLYEYIAAAEHLAQTQETIRGAMELSGQAMYYNKDVVDQDIDRLRILADVGKSAAQDIAVEFARTGTVSQELKEKLIALVGDFAAATGQEAPKAAADLLKMFEDPAKGAEHLAKTLSGVLSPAQEKQIEALARNGDKMAAQQLLFDSLGGKIDGFRQSHLTPLQEQLEHIGAVWHSLTSLDMKGFLALQSGENPTEKYKALHKDPSMNDNDVDPYMKARMEANNVIREGNALEKEMGLFEERKNALIAKEVTLRKAAEAAMTTGDMKSKARFLRDADEVHQQIGTIRPKGSKNIEKEVEEQKKIAEAKVNIEKDSAQRSISIQEEANNQKYALGNISFQEFTAQQLSLENKKYDIEKSSIERRMEVVKNDELERLKLQDELIKLEGKHYATQERLQTASLAHVNENYQHMFNGFSSGIKNMTEQLMRGTISWKNAFKTMCGDMVVEFAKMQVENVAKMLWAAAIGRGITIQKAITERFANATSAAGGAYKAMAGVPYIGPALGAAAAAAAFAGVMAFGLPSAAGGWGEVPNDGLAMIHKKEMVLPANLADKVRNMSDTPLTSAPNNTYHFNISAIDGHSVKDMFMKNGGSIMKAINAQSRNLNPHSPLLAR